jgi:hypothetical protein
MFSYRQQRDETGELPDQAQHGRYPGFPTVEPTDYDAVAGDTDNLYDSGNMVAADMNPLYHRLSPGVLVISGEEQMAGGDYKAIIA